MKKFELKPSVFGNPVPELIKAIFEASAFDSGKVPSRFDVLTFVQKHLEAIQAQKEELSRMDYLAIELYETPEPDQADAFCERMEAAQDFLQKVWHRVFVSKRSIPNRQYFKMAS